MLAHAQGRTSNKPIIYLTFDDGPSRDSVTDRVLDILEEYDAKATFFVTGLRARANPEKVVKIAAAGHALGNHTQSHRRLTELDDYQIVDELSETNRAVYAAGGPALNCFRAPFGATDSRVNGIALRMGLQKVGWTIDTRDWDAFGDPEHLALQLQDSHHGSIILMHDGPSSRWRTLSVFSQWMKDSGDLYDFRALPDCIAPTEGTSFASLDSSPRLPVVKPVTATARTDIPKTVEIRVVETRIARRTAPLPSQAAIGQLGGEQLESERLATAQQTDVQANTNTEVGVEQQLTERELLEKNAIERLSRPLASEETIPGLIEKIRNYKLSLQPEVVAQNEVTSTSF